MPNSVDFIIKGFYMFGSSRKQTVFSPSVYGSNSRRNRRMPRWLITFLAGVITGSGGFWFLQTNYGPPRISLEEAQRLQSTINDLNQEKSALQQQIAETQLTLSQTRELVKQLQPIIASESAEVSASSDLNPITPIQEADTNLDMSSVISSLPPDPFNNLVGIRIGNFHGERGQLNYELVLTKSNNEMENIPARVEMVATGTYNNGNRGFEQLQSINVTANEYVRLQGQVKLSKTTLLPRSVEVKVINTQTRKVLGTRSFEVAPLASQ